MKWHWGILCVAPESHSSFHDLSVGLDKAAVSELLLTLKLFLSSRISRLSVSSMNPSQVDTRQCTSSRNKFQPFPANGRNWNRAEDNKKMIPRKLTDNTNIGKVAAKGWGQVRYTGWSGLVVIWAHRNNSSVPGTRDGCYTCRMARGTEFWKEVTHGGVLEETKWTLAPSSLPRPEGSAVPRAQTH